MKMRREAILEIISNGITGISPLPPDNVRNEQRRTHHAVKQHGIGGGGRTAKFLRQVLQKWASVPNFCRGL